MGEPIQKRCNFMLKIVIQLVKFSGRSASAMALSLTVLLATTTVASADEADAKRLLKAMSDYLAAQQAISFDFDATLEVVTPGEQVLGLASSGNVTLNRPDKIRATRSGGFADVEMSFDGKTVTILGKNLNMYTQVEEPGTLDQLVDVMRTKYGRPLPAADLLLSNSYEVMMQNVIDVKDLGSGVVGGEECDSLAFRTDQVDWQIWIAHGDTPHPCRFVITSKLVANGPQYSIQFSDWKTGDAVAADDFTFKNSTNAEKVELEDLKGAGDMPSNFITGEAQ